MAYPTTTSSRTTGQNSYQVSQPKPMYSTPTPAAPRAPTTPVYSAPATPNPAPLVSAATRAPAAPANDYNSAANVAARAQLAQEAANLARTGNAQGTAPTQTPQQMSQQAEQNALVARAAANPGQIQYGSTNSQGQTYQTYQAPAPAPTYTTPTVQALTGRRTDDGGYAGLTRSQAQTIFGTDFTGINQDADGTFSITADALRGRGGDPTQFQASMVNLGNGEYAVSRPNVWSPAEENILRGHIQELQAVEAQNARPGVDPAIVAQNQYRLEYLRNQVNELGQRKQAYELTGYQDTSGMSNQEYLESLLTNPDVTGTTLEAAQRAVGLNQETYRRQAQQAANSAAEAAQNTIRQNYRNDRDKLINQLAMRGLTPDSDSYAAAQLNELDQRYRELEQAEQAKAQASMLAVDEKTRDYLSKLADKRMEEAHKKIDDFAKLQAAKANALAKETKSKVDLGRLAALEEKNRLWGLNEAEKRELDQMKVDLQERGVDIKEEQNPSIIAKNEASAAQANANAEYTAGARTDKTVADTALTKAKTETEDTLRQARLNELNARIAKMARTGTGGSGAKGTIQTSTPEERLKVDDYLRRTNQEPGKASDKTINTTYDLLKRNGFDVDKAVTSRESGAKTYKGNTATSGGFTPLF